MEIRVLKYFLAVVREGNITKAARSLNLTQPNLSRQINILERDIGHKLFERNYNNIKLTQEGILLKKRSKEIMDLIEKTREEFNFSNDSIQGNIYIGSGETFSMNLIASVMKNIREYYPNIKYNVFSGNFQDISEKLDKGLLDFGILIEPCDLSRYNYLKIPFKDTWGVVMRKDDKLAKKKNILKKDLTNLPLIVSKQAIENKIQDNNFLKWFGDSFDELNIVATYNLIYNASIMVNKGIGYALTLDKLINIYSNQDICFVPLKPLLESELNIVWKKNGELSRASKVFLEELKNNFSSIN